jgi:hypothetical protein
VPGKLPVAAPCRKLAGSRSHPHCCCCSCMLAALPCSCNVPGKLQSLLSAGNLQEAGPVVSTVTAAAAAAAAAECWQLCRAAETCPASCQSQLPPGNLQEAGLTLTAAAAAECWQLCRAAAMSPASCSRCSLQETCRKPVQWSLPSLLLLLQLNAGSSAVQLQRPRQAAVAALCRKLAGSRSHPHCCCCCS